MDANTHAQEFIFSDIIQRVVAYEDPPFRPDLTRVDVRPEFVDLIVDCWCDDPEERPHFFRIVERLKKISGRSVVLQVIVEVLDTTLPITRLGRRLSWCCVEMHCGTLLAGRLILTQLHAYLQNGQYVHNSVNISSFCLDFVPYEASCSGHWTLDNVHASFTLHLFLFLEIFTRTNLQTRIDLLSNGFTILRKYIQGNLQLC